MLVPGIRLIERPGALHMFDGRRVVSITGDDDGRAAIRTAIGDTTPGDAPGPVSAGAPGAPDAAAVEDARRLLADLRLVVTEPEPATRPATHRRPVAEQIAADFVSASTAGWTPAFRAAERLCLVTVHVIGPPASLVVDSVVASLSATGIRARTLAGPDLIAGLDPDRDIVAAVGADHDPVSVLVAANDACVAAGVPLLPIGGYDGARLHVGPLVIPRQSACLDCMLRRSAANVTYPELYDAVLAAPVAPTPAALRQWAAATASLVLLRWIGDSDVRMPGRLFTLVPDELQVRQAPVYRVPRCRVCAAPDFEPRAAPWEPARDH